MILLVSASFTTLYGAVAQNEHSLNPHLKLDFVSRHIWRGIRNNTTPAVQPTIHFESKTLFGGFWASYSLGSENVQEIDIYTGFKYKNISISFYDYYNPIDTLGWNGDFFELSNSKTRHSFDAIINLHATENIPVNILISTMFYGFDKDLETGKNLYSTYMEVSFALLKCNHSQLSVHLGATPFKSYYAKHAAIVNTGLTLVREIHLNSTFCLPIKGSFILNPYTHQVFLLAAFTLQ